MKLNLWIRLYGKNLLIPDILGNFAIANQPPTQLMKAVSYHQCFMNEKKSNEQ